MLRVYAPEANRPRAGLTLVEVALFLCLIGVVLAVSVPTFLRALRTSKMAEAPYELSRIYADVAAYYATVHELPAPPPVKPGSSAARIDSSALAAPRSLAACMPDAAGPAPADASAEPVEVDFRAPSTPGAATWIAIGYQASGSIRYRYTLTPSASGCGTLPADSHGEAVLSLRAEGDLDSDGTLSLFERTATMRDGALSLDPFLLVRDRVE